ncbi:hypothetical protein Ancab_031095 [Ancistrocladus abbreviatus]
MAATARQADVAGGHRAGRLMIIVSEMTGLWEILPYKSNICSIMFGRTKQVVYQLKNHNAASANLGSPRATR